MTRLPGIITLTAHNGERVDFFVQHIVSYGRQREGHTIVQDVCDTNTKAGAGCTLVIESRAQIAELIAAALPQAAELAVSDERKCCCCEEIGHLNQTAVEILLQLRNR